MDDIQGKLKMRAHIISGVVMDIAAFKVSHSIGSDIDTTALCEPREASSSSIASRARSSSMGTLDEVQGTSKGEHTP